MTVVRSGVWILFAGSSHRVYVNMAFCVEFMTDSMLSIFHYSLLSTRL